MVQRKVIMRRQIATENGEASVSISRDGPIPILSRKDFLLTLFAALDESQTRYCVLHSWEKLPDQLSSDLDIAVHPQDNWKLQFVFRVLREKGYTAVQLINYFVDAYCFRFLW